MRVLCWVLATFFGLAGAMKVIGVQWVVRAYEGAPRWVFLGTGVIELVGAGFLALSSSTAESAGALILLAVIVALNVRNRRAGRPRWRPWLRPSGGPVPLPQLVATVVSELALLVVATAPLTA